MSNREDLLLPVGRLVQGSLYEPNTTDLEGRPLIYKSGAKEGQPRVDYYIAVAIEKKGETHWAETAWGAIIWKIGHTAFPNIASSRTFAWKITDGDSTEPNRKGRPPCENDGFPGHWILKFGGGIAPKICNENGTEMILQPNFVNLGDYVQIFGSVNDNGSQQQPGVHLNHQYIAFSRYGKRIASGIDPKSIGFGNSPIPAGASKIPLEPASFIPPAQTASAPIPTPQTSAPIMPHTSILNPPMPAAPPPVPPVAPQRIMLAKANGIPYDAWIAQGWTDSDLIQHGYLQA